jgi:hypothetical protein
LSSDDNPLIAAVGIPVNKPPEPSNVVAVTVPVNVGLGANVVAIEVLPEPDTAPDKVIIWF